ncbi:radical SAM protein [Carboxylicivirga taeanensis]|uniref:radical SAM protein n=1 Tax=Carboxylicivirga taeanensis TaxID=1416875 RepID=UPI003F6E35C9
MEAIYVWLNSLVNKNKSEFAKWSAINWLNPYSAAAYEDQRTLLLKTLEQQVLFKETKPYHKQISKGCSICGSGQWSCLFITNKCNASCFYCPVSQNSDEVPSTQGLEFASADDYAQYIRLLGFKGVSFSGGEPLLYFDRTVDYLKTVRRQCSSDLYVWMYTNGLLADTEKIKVLADAGLDELRFDIGATGFSLDRLKQAKGIIPNVTIEIPAVPEEKDKLIAMLPAMADAGVSNLNLHQMRMTQHNADKLIKRGYTIINAERPLVLESELAALEIIAAAQKQGIDMGINYCSFHFKHRFQKAGYRKMLAAQVYANDSITQAGYVRQYTGDSIVYKLVKLKPEAQVVASLPRVGDLEEQPYLFNESIVFKEENLSVEQQKQIDLLLSSEPQMPPADHLLFQIWQCEYIEPGLRTY